jgi:hypothetical protein
VVEADRRLAASSAPAARPVLVANHQHAHLNRHQPVFALIQNHFRFHFHQDKLAHSRVIFNLTSNQAKDAESIRDRHFNQIAKLGQARLKHPAADGETNRAGT